MFSNSYEPDPKDVKILFQDFGNIREKINILHKKRKFSKLRDRPPLSPDIPHTIVYEDTIIGISSFARYLRSFGSSALVIEPSELRDLMINSSKKILNNYEDNANAKQ